MPPLNEATREIMWNISPAWLMYALFVVALAIFGVGLQRRIASWRRGRTAEDRLSDWGRRAFIIVKELLLQQRVRAVLLPGLMHSLIFYSFLVLVVTTAVVAMDYDFGTTLFRGWVYVILSVGSEIGGLFVIIGVGMFAWRRHVTKPANLPNAMSDLWPLYLLAGISLTGFLIEGVRIAVHPEGDPWAALTPVGAVLALPFHGIDESTGRVIHASLWWLHLVLAFGWIAAIPFTKFFHLVALPTNVFFAKLRPRGALERPDIAAMMEVEDPEAEFKVGTETVSDFTWKQRLDFDACINCGRCDDVCPALAAGHAFSPRQFVSKSLALVQAAEAKRAQDLAAAKAAGGAAPAKDAAADEGETNPFAVVAENNFDEEFFWCCRTCYACTEVCPACIDHVDSMIDVRRNEIMMQGRTPNEAARAMKLLETKGNPFGPMTDRRAWFKALGAPIVPAGGEVDYLLFIGCCIGHDPTKYKIIEDLLKICAHRGIKVGILGDDEKCCGDPARLLGEERLFQEVAQAQLEAIQARTFKAVLTTCPHCLNVFRNEYPKFGATFTVLHHTELLRDLLKDPAVKAAFGGGKRLVYHDPCYLGRYQGQYDAPRAALDRVAGDKRTEMHDHHNRSFCCGAGGGHYWMDLHSPDRPNNLRVLQANAAGADTIVTACAYCKQMLDDSVKLKDLEDKIKVVDIASVVCASLGLDDAKKAESAPDA